MLFKDLQQWKPEPLSPLQAFLFGHILRLRFPEEFESEEAPPEQQDPGLRESIAGGEKRRGDDDDDEDDDDERLDLRQSDEDIKTYGKQRVIGSGEESEEDEESGRETKRQKTSGSGTGQAMPYTRSYTTIASGVKEAEHQWWKQYIKKRPPMFPKHLSLDYIYKDPYAQKHESDDEVESGPSEVKDPNQNYDYSNSESDHERHDIQDTSANSQRGCANTDWNPNSSQGDISRDSGDNYDHDKAAASLVSVFNNLADDNGPILAGVDEDKDADKARKQAAVVQKRKRGRPRKPQTQVQPRPAENPAATAGTDGEVAQTAIAPSLTGITVAVVQNTVTPERRGPGRPRKLVTGVDMACPRHSSAIGGGGEVPDLPKRRGRPRKNPVAVPGELAMSLIN
ncbi:hypothetical protein D9758_011068 [Tetrapyrgos nigripes]|uniref:Uncharacterized protein n=1 Tax=Tetrapyrgos nigripes TaxID=182062 RepID=A0A8H5FS73_9AGAR|nr:hypothetical protein D9758_011068 [Tetrapyrgos nigripes]